MYGRAQTECDVYVVHWTEAVLSEPHWQSVQGERSSDVVASLPVGPGLVRARSDVVGGEQVPIESEAFLIASRRRPLLWPWNPAPGRVQPAATDMWRSCLAQAGELRLCLELRRICAICFLFLELALSFFF
jgi:hypothetical protein